MSNEESTPIDVFFDDFKVTQTHSPVVQKSDYQAFGLEFNSYSRASITAQNFKFNAGSEQEQMTDWYSTPFRKYDPSLGRFHGVDALADLYSSTTPSHFGMNNPINYNDPTGLTVAPKSENQKQGAGGGTQHRHLPNGLGANNSYFYGRSGSLFWDGWTTGIWESDWDAHNGSKKWRDKKAAAGKTGYYDDRNGTWYTGSGAEVTTNQHGQVVVAQSLSSSSSNTTNSNVTYEWRDNGDGTEDLYEIVSLVIRPEGGQVVEANPGIVLPMIAAAEEVLIALGIITGTAYHANSKKNRNQNYLYEIRSYGVSSANDITNWDAFEVEKYGISADRGGRVQNQVNKLNQQNNGRFYDYVIKHDNIPGRYEALLLERFYVTYYAATHNGDVPNLQYRPLPW